ncbi:LysR family transcriptional regulator [Thalassospira australica]|uniref:LysR family transcriptional regulator n=1 Tax=Thalassospira australica TaxID=1528106 RepID=UPI000519FCB0|nr:LysR family transcriptional regulator [Thalassospira australica]
MNKRSENSLTLRQIEVMRAVMISGSITGASKMLNVSQPGISRTMKHLESSLGVALFTRTGGRYVPTPAAQQVFLQMQEIDKKLRDLNFSISQLERGHDVNVSLASVPSIAHVMVPRAAAGLKKRYPDIRMNIEILKIEEAIDFLLLGKGDFVCMSYRFDHPSITFEPLSEGHLVCVCHKDHPLAQYDSVSVSQIAQCPLIGIDPNDPYGKLLARIFDVQGLEYHIEILARFGTTVLGLVQQNLGVAVLDCFTVDGLEARAAELTVIPIQEKTIFSTWIARREDIEISSFSQTYIDILRQEMANVLMPRQL